MRVLVQLGHPAHFHLYKHLVANLMKDGHDVLILIKKKDILEDLLKESGLPYLNILPNGRKPSKWGIIKGMIIRFVKVFNLAFSKHIDLLIGSCTEVAQVGKILHKHSIVMAEDDACIVPQFIKLVAPFVDTYLTPITCNNGVLDAHSIKYPGFHKLAYLHPNQFVPSEDVVKSYFGSISPYFLLRFAQLNAYHDISNKARGISSEVAQQLVDLLLPHGNVYITSERELEPQFEKYRLNINPLDIHHVMAYASIYIGDSQSMAVEAAMLGTPSIRFNDFAGRIGVLEELEHKYELTVGIPSDNPQLLFDTVASMLKDGCLKNRFASRRNKMLCDKIDVTAFLTWFVENYPESRDVVKADTHLIKQMFGSH